MKRGLLFAIPAAIIMSTAFVSAEETTEENVQKVACEIEDGDYVITIPVEDGDEGWKVDTQYMDDEVLKVGSEELADDTFVARIEPVEDGEATVVIGHYDGIACDKRMTFDLVVEDGKVKEAPSGSNVTSPTEEELEPLLTGKWAEEETQFTQMTITKNPEKGFDVEAAAPLTHGAYVFKATIYYDCNAGALIYDNGAFYEVPITDSDEAELGDPVQENTTGLISFDGDEEDLHLVWFRGQEEGELVRFERAEE